MTFSTARLEQAARDFDFRQLFIEELGWDRHTQDLRLTIDGRTFHLRAVAEKRGMVAMLCIEDGGAGIVPEYATRGKVERHVAKLAHEHIIVFVDKAMTRQVWQWVKREPGRPVATREHVFTRDQKGTALVQKLARLAVSLDEEAQISLVDVTGRARSAFDVENVTKRFYERFERERTEFLKFIKGIADAAERSWYGSLMLNRLMFVYFIQKKRFLDGDVDYLRTRLRLVEARKGRNQFHSFYRTFLLRLFHDGLGARKRDAELVALIGGVPYLNGGLFDVHELEVKHASIEIPDEAFRKLFDFFDAYHWHLDERPVRADNEINPDVLGHIFEKYINQKAMGAYYTKEDITEYIAQNTIIPHLFDEVFVACPIAFEPDGVLWRLLREDPDRYIPDSMRVGVDIPLPAGLDADEGGNDTGRLAGAEFALPQETWRDHLARRRRVEAIRVALRAGEITSIDELISRNLHIRQFAQDVIENCEGADLLRAFYRRIERVSVLDPTCGSGAFLFAALNILEPLYEACLDRMEVFVSEADLAGRQDRIEAYTEFRAILAAVASHPSRRYFVLKSIVIRNLYGVDIMDEAAEICTLRLFLKLVAQVDSPNDVEALPDVDFNIQAGNSLVGFAVRDELAEALTRTFDFDHSVADIESQLASTDLLADEFRSTQTRLDGAPRREQKLALIEALAATKKELDRHLARHHGKDKPAAVFKEWLGAHQPFHWFLQYHAIVKDGGFDVIIGNPPYVEVPRDLDRGLLGATFRTAMPRWSRDEDLYTFVVERSLRLLRPQSGRFGMILPLSIAFSTKRPFESLRDVVQRENGPWWFSHFDRIPSALFGNEVRTRCTIALHARRDDRRGNALTEVDVLASRPADASTTGLLRWPTESREHLFPTLHYSALSADIKLGLPKVSSQIQADALRQLLATSRPLALDLTEPLSFQVLADACPRFPKNSVFVGGTAYNWFPAWREIPETTDIHGRPSLPARTVGFRFRDEATANVVFALLCSSLGYWWWAVASDGFNLKKWLIQRFPMSTGMLSVKGRIELANLGEELRRALRKEYVFKDNRGRIGNFFLPNCGAEVAAIDACLARSVTGLSQEFFSDVRAFNASFTRAIRATEDDGEGADDE